MSLLNIFLIIDWGQLRERPFLAEVWGTVNDLLTTIFTAGSLAFLIYTFLRQQRFNETQIEVNRLALEQHRRNIRPNIKIHKKKHDHKSAPNEIEFHVEHAYAKNISIYEPVDFEGRIVDNQQPFKFVNYAEPGEIICTTPFPDFVKTQATFLSGKTRLHLYKIWFQDEDGRDYWQFVIMEQSNKQIETTFPEWQENFKKNDDRRSNFRRH